MFRVIFLSAIAASLAGAAPMTFDFASADFDPSIRFTRERGHGFEIGATPRKGGGCITADAPFLFSVMLPEGNYHVETTLGDAAGDSTTTVKAESRRLMLENIRSTGGTRVIRRFVVNIRTPDIAGGGRVGLKTRENDYLHWDDKLTLEFGGVRPCVSKLVITPAPELPTLYLLGDSTVTDQPNEPWNSWGQMITRFLKPDIAVANYAESGESIRSSLGARRVAKVLSLLRKGDFVLVQFGHNDMKDKRDGALELYESNLTALVRDVRAKSATPVLVTSMERKAGVKKETLGDYPATVRKVATAEKAALIDLQPVSRTLYAALGADLDKAFVDGTHHSNFGSYEIARCVVEGIRAGVPALANHIATDAKPFDPAKPDDPSAFDVPASPMRDPAIPDGS
jgi:lysophospholipase L1-like esterase